MLISGADAYATTISSTVSELERRGRHNTLLAHPRQANFPLFHSPFESWEDLLKDAMDSGETRRQEHHEKCCETGGSAWLCTLCQILPYPRCRIYHLVSMQSHSSSKEEAIALKISPRISRVEIMH